MFKKILVPLDGSETSEQILPHLEQLLRTMDADLRLIHVCAQPSEGKKYLDRVAEEIDDRFPGVSERVVTGDPVREIIGHALEGKFDFIAMTTHGRSGLSRLVFGSTAEELLRASPVPLFLVRPDVDPVRFRTILVPLDGSHRAETILPLACDFASSSGGKLLLVTVLPAKYPTPVTLSHVKGIRESVEDHGIEAQIVVRHGGPVKEILAVSEARKADLIAISTHGRSGLDRLRFGSVAESILRTLRLPLLVLRTAGMLPRYRALLSKGRYRARKELVERLTDD